MIHICYVFIYKYRCLENVDLVIDPRYDYSFCQNSNELTISPSSQSPSLPEDFWGKNIHSLTAIFGNNGAGKTTAIRFIKDCIVNGNNNPDNDGFIVYEKDSKLYVWQNKYENNFFVESNRAQITCKTEAGISCETTKERPTLECFFYSGHFAPELIFDLNLRGLYNASDSFRLRQDLEDFSNAGDPYFTFPISSYLAGHISQNNDRICRLLINEKLGKSLEDLNYRLPRFITIVPNRGGQNHLKLRGTNKAKSENIENYLNPPPIKGLVPTKGELLHRFIYFNLLNAYADNAIDDYEIITNWYEIKIKDNVLKCYQDFFGKKQENIKLQNIYYVVSFIDKYCQYNKETGTFYFDVLKDKKNIERLISLISSNNIFLTSRFFDMNYSHEINSSYCSLSSGEQSMLNLFSRLYDAIVTKPNKITNLEKPAFLIFDEAEIGFHPEWQRNFINVILNFLKALNEISPNEYQIIISSHSPLLQSDIPVNCCNYLKTVGDKTSNVRESHTQTFASNVFELYRDSFFLEEGLIGEFAKKRIKSLENNINDNFESIDDIESEINLIGDERLRLYFYDLLSKSKKGKMAAIKFYEEQIKRLKEDKQ